MIDIDEWVAKLAQIVPQGARADLRQQFREVLQSLLAKLDLVTREEFDVQCAVLAKTRAKVEALTLQLAEFEKNSIEQ